MSRHTRTLLGCLGFGGMMACVPLALRLRQGDKITIEDEKPLGPSTIQRGVFMNSGSKDAGPDPDWVGEGAVKTYQGNYGHYKREPPPKER